LSQLASSPNTRPGTIGFEPTVVLYQQLSGHIAEHKWNTWGKGGISITPDTLFDLHEDVGNRPAQNMIGQLKLFLNEHANNIQEESYVDFFLL
jgi:hypothetical protein